MAAQRRLLLPDWHGVSESAQIQMNLLRRHVDGEKSVSIFMEPIAGASPKGACKQFNNGSVDCAEFMDMIALSRKWGPEGAYKTLFDYAISKDFRVHPGDVAQWQRNELVRAYLKVIEQFKRDGERKTAGIAVNENLRGSLCGDREWHFARVMVNSQAKLVVFVTHPAHMDGVAQYLRGEVIRPKIAPTELRRLGKVEDEVQLQAAEKLGLFNTRSPDLPSMTQLPLPPAVPVISAAYSIATA